MKKSKKSNPTQHQNITTELRFHFQTTRPPILRPNARPVKSKCGVWVQGGEWVQDLRCDLRTMVVGF